MKETHHSQLEPQPVLRGGGYQRDAASLRLELAHELVEREFERVGGGGVQHVRVVDCLEVVSVGFWESNGREKKHISF